jgi:hypothetical protein
MKLLLVALGVVGVFFLSGGNNLVNGSMNALAAEVADSQSNIEGQPLDSWVKQVETAFDPTWYENLKNADLVTLLKASSGSSK